MKYDLGWYLCKKMKRWFSVNRVARYCQMYGDC